MLTNVKIESYAKHICQAERIGKDQRRTSFKFCASRMGALRDLRLWQLAQGLYSAQEVL